jgi:hypothetical protein
LGALGMRRVAQIPENSGTDGIGYGLDQSLVAARAINWAKDRHARGAYSYATTETRAAQSVISTPVGKAVFYSGEALYRGRDMGTVEAALASGLETARTVLRA